MYLCQEDTLRKNRVSFTSDLDPRGPVLDSLIQDGILTDNDAQVITSSATQRERVRKLLSILPTRGPAAYESFRKALKNGDYDHLAEKLPDTTSLPSEERQFRLHCDECDDFLKSVQNDVRNKDLFIVLQKYPCLFLDNIEVENVTDVLFEASIVNQRNLDRIGAKETKYDRCLCLFKILLVKEDSATVPTLYKALMKKYRYILNAMNQLNPQGITNETNDCRDNDTNQTVHTSGQSTCSDLNTKRGKNVSIRDAIDKEQFKNGAEPSESEEHESVPFDEVDSGFNETCDSFLPFERAEIRSETTHQPLRLQDNVIFTKTGTTTHKEYLQSGNAFHNDKSVSISSAYSYIDSDNCKQNGSSNRVDEGHNELYKQVSMISPCNQHQLQTNSTFALLSSLINEGKIDTFKEMSSTFSKQFSHDYDIRFIVGYLHARADLFANDFESSKRHVQATLQIAKKSSNPHLFTLELLNSESRIYLGQKQLQKLRTLLDELIAQARSNYLECRGRLAGWLFLNDARCTTAQMCQIDFRRKTALKLYKDLYEKARDSFFRSMDNFTFERNECGLEGDLGLAYAACRFVILLMCCGDNGLTMANKELEPPDIDIMAARKYINLLEAAETSLPPIIQMQVCLGKCDFYFRQHDLQMAYSMAFKAQEIAKDNNIREFDEHVRNRIAALNKLWHSRNHPMHVSELKESDSEIS
ncbi:uncharacterized protein LOC128211467 isoform X2 [Mya arenaria]|nr:uncharacterized protein LOC128211467 isoform X2 [Mya arenaria]